MEQLRQQIGKKKRLSSILREENTLLYPEKKNQRQMVNALKFERDNIIKDVKNLFRLKKEIEAIKVKIKMTQI